MRQTLVGRTPGCVLCSGLPCPSRTARHCGCRRRRFPWSAVSSSSNRSFFFFTPLPPNSQNSNPIGLLLSAQRSGQELPLVESFSPASCLADGGEELTIFGSNLSAQSRVLFSEKGPGALLLTPTRLSSSKQAIFFSDLLKCSVFASWSDGRSLWEVEARVLSDRSSAVSENDHKMLNT